MPSEIAAHCAMMTDELKPPAEGARADAALTRLVERAAAGDAAAFEQLLIATERRVVSVAWRMLGDREDARDAAQEVFLRVYKYLPGFRMGEDFHGWLYRITVNVCRDAARRRGRARHEDLESLFSNESGHLKGMPSAAGRAPDIAEVEALRGQQRALLRHALLTLPEKERAAIVLRDIEGLSTEEVARILHTRPVTVRSQISSARQKLKTICDGWLRKGGRNV
ncbi:MAG: RNA polymerase sigma factor [Pyrinomonadaceae bacterium]